MTKTGRIARVLPLALLAATALTSQAWAVGCPGTPYASYTTLLDSLDTSLTFNCQTGKLGITLGTPSQLGGYTLGSGLQAPSGALGVLYGRSANTALQGNDPAVAAALTAVQPAALTAAIAAIPASNNVAIGLVSGTARDAAAAIQAETTALNAANAAQSTANGAATAAALTGETQRAQIAEAGKVSTSSLATVAFSGSYNDLANKPGTVSFPGGALTSGTGTSVAVGTGLSLTGGVLNASGSGGGTTYTGSGPVVVSGTTISLGAPSGVTPGATLAKAAFTGAYSDLSGLPTLLAIGTTTGTAADGGSLAAEIARAQTAESAKAATTALAAETARAQAAESAAIVTAKTISAAPIYTASGAIAPTDTLSIVNCASACTVTLAQGADGHHQIIKRHWASAVVTLTATIDGSSQSIVLNTTGSLKESVTLDEVASLSSYILE